MIQDRGPRTSIGYGTAKPLVRTDEGVSPESGIIAKTLGEHPIMRFMAVSAATMVGMHVAGKLVREGGVALGKSANRRVAAQAAADAAAPVLDRSVRAQTTRLIGNSLHDVRAIRKVTNEWVDTTVFRGIPEESRNISRHHEMQRLRKLGMPVDTRDDWTIRDQMRSRMVSIARRLPYEMPALYATQRGLIDPMMGEKSDTNWANPVDVLGDFAQSSIKNLAFMVTPWEAGSDAVKWGFKDFIAQADVAIGSGNSHILANGFQSLLNEVGSDFAKATRSAINTGSRLTYSFGSGVQAAMAGRQIPTEIKKRSWQTVHQTYKTTGGTPRERLKASLIASTKPGEVAASVTFADSVGGSGSFLHAFRSEWKGLSGKNKLPGARAQELAARDLNKTSIEHIADSLVAVGGDKQLGHKTHGELYQMYARKRYADFLRAGLQDGSIDASAAERAVKLLTIRKLPGQQSASKWQSRLGFAEDPYNTEFIDAFKSDLGQAIGRSRGRYLSAENRAWGEMQAGAIADRLGAAVKSADEQFLNQKNIIRAESEAIWTQSKASGGMIDQYIKAKLKTNKKNIFGFRSMNLDEALGDRGYFSHLLIPKAADINNVKTNARKTLESINKSYGGKNIRVGNVWVHEGGEILDVNPLANALKQTANILADKLQVPLIHLKPLNTMFYGTLRSMSHKPGMMTMSSESGALLPGSQKGKDGYLWFSGGRNSYAYGIDYKGETFNRIDRVRAAPTDAESLVGRNLRLAIGDKGVLTDRPVRGRFGKAFDVNPDQPKSMYEWLKRFGRHVGVTEEATAGMSFGEKVRFSAKRIIKPKYGSDWDTNVESLARLLSGSGAGNFLKSIETGTNAEKLRFARAFDALEKRIGAQGQIHDRALRQLEEANPSLKNLWSRRRGDGDARSLWRRGGGPHGASGYTPLPDGVNIPFSQFTHYPTSVRTHSIDSFFGQSTKDIFAALPDDVRVKAEASVDAAARSGRYLLGRNIDLGDVAPAMSRKAGLNRRIDELTQVLLKFDAIREDIITEFLPNVAGRQSTVQRLLGTVDELRLSGSITNKEFIELRAAALSIDIGKTRALSASNTSMTNFERTLEVANAIVKDSSHRETLSSIGSHTANFPDAVIPSGIRGRVARLRRGMNKYATAGNDIERTYNPFGTDKVLLPTTRGVMMRNPIRGLKSVAGISNWSDPTAYSSQSILSSHLFERLDRYFGTFHAGLDTQRYKGPLDFYARGLVGRRVLPTVAAGSALLAADSTLGGLVHKKDENDKRVYSPLFLGAAATGIAGAQVGLAGVLPGGETFQQKKEQIFGDEKVPVRKGRWWLLGNTPWKGGRIMYYHSSWYKRFKAGTQYTGQLWDSPAEKLAFGSDFSPLKYLDPYHFERKHYKDRPYPVTGELLTGPWGPLNGAVNATLGKILKPSIRMHRKEVDEAMTQYASIGEFGATIPRIEGTGPSLFVNDRGRMRVGVPSSASQILGMTDESSLGQNMLSSVGGTATRVTGVGGGGGFAFAKEALTAPLSMGSGAGTQSMGENMTTWGAPKIVGDRYYSESGRVSRIQLNNINENYVANAKKRLPLSREEALRIPYYLNPRLGMPNDIIPNQKPRSAGSFGFQASEAGYQLQEMAGIYGFIFGSAREALGFGSQDLSPQRPILTAASRAYGAERGFWDRYLGGMGDLPTPFEGEYGNIEVSEIVRRFVPHRRRDIHELNPIKNEMGKEYPWLPGSNYFQNFQEGDPYALIPEGETRLPGAAYERLNKLHPDQTGKYGLVDQFKILGDIAPWSDQYRSMTRMMAKADMSEQEKETIATVRRQAAARNKPYEFSPYKYAGQDFKEEELTISQRVFGTADQFITEELGKDKPIRLAGVRARSEAAQAYMDKLLAPGTKVNAKFDTNAPRGVANDAIISLNGENVNKKLISEGYGTAAKTDSPIDENLRTNPLLRPIKALGETISHRDTIINTKFLQKRTATEDWERRNVYSSSFSQWQHPIRDYISPSVFKAGTENPIFSGVTLGLIGGMFGADKQARMVGRFVGAGIGVAASLIGPIRRKILDRPAIPEYRVKELAIEENADILQYVKYSRLYAQARQQAIESGEGDPEKLVQKANYEKRKDTAVALGPAGQQAQLFRKEIQHTMYGADPFGDVQDLVMAIPKRKRQHFQEMLSAPKKDRERILSTAGRLERRLLQARWDMKVEKRPELGEYFSKHELPSADWEGWDPAVDMDNVKIKVMQQQGLDMSQIGYYPQQVEQANLVNMSYPDFNGEQSHHQSTAMLRSLMSHNNIAGNVISFPNPFGENRFQMQLGVAS